MRPAVRSPPGHWRPLVVLAAGVLALHLALLSRGGPVLAVPPGQARPGPLRPSIQLLPRDGLGPAVPTAGPRAPALPGPLDAPGAVRQADGVAAPRPAVAVRVPGSSAGPLADPALPVAADDAAGAADAAGAVPAGAGEPPPLYPTRLPDAATLRYALHYHGRAGQAVLVWRPAGTSYTVQLQGLPATVPDAPAASPRSDRGGTGPARPLIEQASQGQLDASGLAPDRFTDRRGGRTQRAANFRREQGLIAFSVPAEPVPAWPGAQDRLSWWVQMPAIVAAAAVVPADVRLFVVDARGRGELWRFEYLGQVVAPAGAGPATVQHWRHEPAQPEGQRVELWLDPAQGHWPVQLRLTLLRSGARFELQLLAIDPPPP